MITGGLGRDLLYGDEGADTFVFLTGKTFDHVDIVRDFKTSEGDKIDLSDVLHFYDENQHDINDFLQLSQIGNNTNVLISEFGSSSSFQTALTIEHGVTETLDQLLNNGTIIV